MPVPTTSQLGDCAELDGELNPTGIVWIKLSCHLDTGELPSNWRQLMSSALAFVTGAIEPLNELFLPGRETNPRLHRKNQPAFCSGSIRLSNMGMSRLGISGIA